MYRIHNNRGEKRDIIVPSDYNYPREEALLFGAIRTYSCQLRNELETDDDAG